MDPASVPPPPPGFTLLPQPQAGGAVPPPPPGFTMIGQPHANLGALEQDIERAVDPMLEAMRLSTPGGAVQEPAPDNGPWYGPSDAGAAADLQVGAQGIGRGLADLAGFPVDIATLIGNTGLAMGEGAINLALPEEKEVSLPRIEQPVGGGDWIAEQFGRGYEALGGDLIEPEDMNGAGRLAYNVSRYGAQGLAGGAGLQAAAARRGMSATPELGDFMLRPYAGGAGARTVIGDAAGGAGSGAALTAAESYDPDNPYLQLVAMLGGGVAGASLGQAATKPKDIVDYLSGFGTDYSVPYAPGSMAPTSRRVADLAADVVRGQTTDPQAAAARIAERTAAARGAGMPVPTTGIASDDIGLIGLEKGLRQAGSEASPDLRRRFVESDDAVKKGAAEHVFGLRDPEADLNAPARVSAARQADTLRPFDEAVASAEEGVSAARRSQEAAGATISGARDQRFQTDAARRLDEALVDREMIPTTRAKNEAFEALDPERTTMVPADDVISAARAVRDTVNELGPERLQMPEEFLRRLESLAPDMQPTDSGLVDLYGQPVPGTPRNAGGTGEAALGDLVDVRKYLSTAHQAARRAGNFTLADNIARLRTSINRTIDQTPAAAEANTRFREEFAPRYRQGDEMEAFQSDVVRHLEDGQRGEMPPRSATPGRFLSSPEKTEQLNRVLAASPSREEGMSAVRDWLLSDFASAAVGPDGTMNPRRAEAWLRDNGSIVGQYPGIRAEFEGFARQGVAGEQAAAGADEALRAARSNLTAGEQEFERSAAATLLRDDPRNVARQILTGRDYDASEKMAQITGIVADDPEAARGWRAAVADVLSDRVQSTRNSDELSVAQVDKVWRENRDTLAEVFSPEDMKVLDTAHEALEPLKNLAQQTVPGSATVDNTRLSNAVEAAVLAGTGNAITTGMIMKRMRMAANLIGLGQHTASYKAARLVERMMFDPELARVILARPAKEATGSAWNAQLRNAIVASQFSREQSDDDEVVREVEGADR